MSKVYISGKITGDNNFKEKFNNAVLRCCVFGWGLNDILNPVDLPTQTTWEDYMIQDIKELFNCTHIYMISDWEQSKGARIEHAIAVEYGLTIIYQQQD